jgi:hypothetical protein
MSEKVYAWLLRLYPPRFREAYGDEALQLFRDRFRHERGFFPRLRLWLDLLADFAISVPRMRREVQPALSGAPSFQVLESESLRPGAMLLGAALSLAAFGTGSFLISHGGNHWPLSPIGGVGEEAIAAGLPVPRNSVGVNSQAEPEGARLDAAERKRVIDRTIANLKEYYVYPDVAQKMAEALLAHENRGDYDRLTHGDAFAGLLTDQLRSVSPDFHLSVGYGRLRLPDRLEPSPQIIAGYRLAMQYSNCTFRNVEMLPHNIGYLKFNSFPDPSLCQATAEAAMAKLNNASAIIFDLRSNGGGSPKMVALIASYFFDHPTHLNDMYNRAENSTLESWTRPPVPGNKLANKPAYVLTAAGTYSAAEEFSYDLKMLKRAALVGETTGGGAHMAKGHRIDDHFLIFVPDTRAINPISKTNWEGTGVEPDVKVKAADALITAQKMAWNTLRKKQ